MNRAIDAIFDAIEPRAFSAASASDILTWAMVGIALLSGLVYGPEWAAKGFPYKPDMTIGVVRKPVLPQELPAVLQDRHTEAVPQCACGDIGKARVMAHEIKPLLQERHEPRPVGAALEKI